MKKIFSTNDIVLAASLQLHKKNMIKIEKHGNRGVFVFENIEDDFLNNYDLGKIVVEPVGFSSTVKQLTISVKRVMER